MAEPRRPDDADLVRWADAARDDGLPEPTTQRWAPLRAGVVNLWEFDVAEYWFAGGRAQLVGQNQSGKSSLMTLTSLIMLAGDLNPSLVDTFGDRHKSFRYYVEPTSEPTDRRETDSSTARGWTWVELGRSTPEGPRFFTLLLYAQAKRGGALGRTWATAQGSARVRGGIDLHVGSAVRAPADVDGIELARNGTEYTDRVARRLWGFSSVERLDAVVRILKVLRTPHLGQRLDPDFFTERMRDALLALDTGEVDKLAEGWEQLERLAADRDEARDALAATQQFLRRAWHPWADAVLRRAGDALVAAVTRVDNVTRDERRARESLAQAEEAREAVDTAAARARQEHADAQTRYEAHLKSPGYQEAAAAVARAQLLAAQAVEVEDRAVQAQQRATETGAVHAARAAERDGAAGQRDREAQGVDAAVLALVQAGEPARFPDGWRDWVAAHDITRLTVLVRERREQVRSVRRLLRAQRDTAVRFEQADAALAEAETALRTRSQASRAATEQVETELVGLSEHLETWARDLGGDGPVATVRDRWVRAVTEQAGSTHPRSVLPALVRSDWLTSLTEPLAARVALESEAARGLDEQADAEDAEADAAEAQTEPEPVAPSGWSRRTRPPAGTDGAPLWWLLDPAEHLAPVELDHVEAALGAMGLLDAWVSADGVWREERDGAEIVLVPTASGRTGDGARLSDVLHGTGAGPQEVVGAALAMIGYGSTLDQAPQGDFALAADGRWRTPLASGRAAPAPHGAELIGAAARSAARARRVAELRVAATAHRSEATDARERAAAAAARIDALGRAADALSDAPVVRLSLAAVAARGELERAAGERDRTAGLQQQALVRADDARAALLEEASQRQLPADDEGLDAVAAAVDATDSGAGLLRTALVGLRAATDRVRVADDLLGEARAALTRDQEAAQREAGQARAARIEADAAGWRLADPERDVLAEGVRLEAERNRLAAEADRLTGELQANVRVVDAATDTVRRAGEERERTVAERDAAARDWAVPVAAGLARARGLSADAVSTLTGAVEQARAARARLRPPGWPDGDDPEAKRQRTEQAFTRLVTAVGDLEPRLRALGGRSAALEEAREDGGLPEVVLRVDSLGEPLAPLEAVTALERSVDELTATYDQQLGARLEELLSSTFVDHLRERLAGVLALVGDVNRVLAAHPTGATRTTLRLARVPAAGHEDGFAVLEALRGRVVGEEGVQRQIRTFLEQQIRTAQQEGGATGVDWKERLADLLDYRRWFAMITEFSVPSGPEANGSGPARKVWRPLTRQVHGRDSGGGKAVTLLQPLLATLVALYAEAPDGPRPLWLDEAFTGVDDLNRVTMLDLLVDFDLDFLAAGPDTLVAVSAVPSAAVWHVTRAPAPVPGVELSLTLWAGDRLVALPTPDAEPLAVAAGPVGTDSLFDADPAP